MVLADQFADSPVAAVEMASIKLITVRDCHCHAAETKCQRARECRQHQHNMVYRIFELYERHAVKYIYLLLIFIIKCFIFYCSALSFFVLRFTITEAEKEFISQ